jgi:hypothetical protein
MNNHSRDNNGMIKYKDYVAGWIDSSISEFLEFFPKTSARMDFALITSLDSDLSPRDLLSKSPELKPLQKNAKPIGSGVLVPTSLILGAAKEIFYGFDEVWFFPKDRITPRPQIAWLVGPNRISQPKLDELGEWIVDNDCTLGLGDGDGLNFLVKAHGLVKYLLAYSIHQPEPKTGGEEEDSLDNERREARTCRRPSTSA